LTAHGYEGLIPRLQLDLAETLLSRRAPGDHARAARLLDEVRAPAARVEAQGLADQADRVDLNRHRGGPPTDQTEPRSREPYGGAAGHQER
jgi:hypothetical protein